MRLRGLPQGMFWRLAAILLGAVALAVAIAALFFGIERDHLRRDAIAQHAARRIVDAQRMLDHAAASDRRALAAAFAAAGVELDRAWPAASAVAQDAELAAVFGAALRRRLDPGRVLAVAAAADDAARVRFAAQLRATDGAVHWWTLDAPHEPDPPPPHFLLPALVALLLAVGSAVLVAVRGLTRPLSALATAARTLGTPAEGEALAEVGPAEVRQVARAFNDMRQRIGAMVDEKTRMLAAISHDLRAPITRMRLRVELLEDAEARAKLIADLEELHRLTDEALDFLRGAGGGEVAAHFDLARLARAIVSEAREVGHDVVLVAPASVVLVGRAGALRRCLQNLVDNAVRHAGSAEIELGTGDGAARLWVRDRGPGLAPDDLDRAFEPFFRGDPARGHANGFGLGLPIARAIARQHGGEVTLRARPGGGLEAEVSLPLVVPVGAA